MGQVIFGNGKQTGGVFVNAVDNARAQLPVDAGKALPHGVEQAVHQSVVLMPRRRMDNKPFGLVDDGHILVFIYNIQLHFGGGHVNGPGFRNGDADGLSGLQTVIFFGGLPV